MSEFFFMKIRPTNEHLFYNYVVRLFFGYRFTDYGRTRPYFIVLYAFNLLRLVMIKVDGTRVRIETSCRARPSQLLRQLDQPKGACLKVILSS